MEYKFLSLFLIGCWVTNTVVTVQSQMLPSGISPEDFVRSEFELFERERQQFLQSEYGHDEGHRWKRTVMFNGDAAIDLGLLIGIPLSVALPSLKNFFHFDKTKVKRDLKQDEIYEENPMLEPHLERISAYFQLLNIQELACQERAICEFAADPVKYFPISDLILNRLRHPSTNHLMGVPLPEYETKNQTRSLFLQFSEVGDIGSIHGTDACTRKFSDTCPFDTEKRLNMQVLSFWNFLTTTLRLNLKDDLEFY